VRSLGGILLLGAGCAAPVDPVSGYLRGFLAEGDVHAAAEYCVDVLEVDPFHPAARSMLWPLVELVDDDTRRSVIAHHGAGVHAFQRNYPDRCLTPTFLRGCRKAHEGDLAGAREAFRAALSEPSCSRYGRVLQREAALRSAGL